MLDALRWDGQRLTIVLQPADQARRLVLSLDGLRFSERELPAEVAAQYFDFPFSPSGGDELAFSLRLEPAGIELLPAPWRVRFGVAAAQGVAIRSARVANIDRAVDGAIADRSDELAPLEGAAIFSPLQQPQALLRPVTILVPIYNAAEHVQRCIEALIEHTQAPARLLLIDDASDDPAIAPLLARHAHLPGIRVLRNAQNLGYTRSIALGLGEATEDDIVVLNADTEVGPNWLLGLRRAAYARTDFGTATAVSDNAGAFSVPELEQHNALPAAWSLAQTQRALWQHSGLATPALPTGNGFCMYLKRVLLDSVGGPDLAAFPQGYGEENDWCQRAEQAGFVHVIAGNVLVRHARSASFGEARRAALGAAGMAVLRERYPHYEAAVGATLFSFERRVLDWRVRHVYRSTANACMPPRPRVLWLAASPQRLGAAANTDLAAALASEFDLWCLSGTEDGLCLLNFRDAAWRELRRVRIAACLDFAPSSWLRYDEQLASWLQHYAIELVHVFDRAGHSGHLDAIVRALALPLLDRSASAESLDDADALRRRYRMALAQQRSFVAPPSD